MNDTSIRDVLLHAIGRIAPEADLSRLDGDDDLREALDLDSMDFLRLITAAHEALGVNIPESDYRQMFTLASAVAYLERRVKHGN